MYKKILIVSLSLFLLTGCGRDEMVDDVVGKIDTIGSEISVDDMYKIEDIENAYNNLTDDQKSKVSNIDSLTDAADTLDSFINEAPYNYAIDIVNTIYNHLDSLDNFSLNKVQYASGNYEEDDSEYVFIYVDYNYSNLVGATVRQKCIGAYIDGQGDKVYYEGSDDYEQIYEDAFSDSTYVSDLNTDYLTEHISL